MEVFRACHVKCDVGAYFTVVTGYELRVKINFQHFGLRIKNCNEVMTMAIVAANFIQENHGIFSALQE